MTALQNVLSTYTFYLVLYAPLIFIIKNFAAAIRAQHMYHIAYAVHMHCERGF